MQDHYEMIKRGRAVLLATPKSQVRDSTAADYLRKVQRLRARGKGHGGGLFDGAIAEALKTTKKASWHACQAGVVHSARAGLEAYLAKQDKLQRACRAAELVGQTAQWGLWKWLAEPAQECAEAIEAVEAATFPLAGRVDRHTKRQDMKGLPPDWRELVIARMPGYHLATLTAAVTGCRPAELVSGAQLSIEGGQLIAVIKGAKVDVDAGKAMSNAAARQWPGRKTAITPYWFRHQVAADMKAAGTLDSGEISAAPGHLSDATKSTYGHANMCKGRGVATTKVTAARPVRMRTPAQAQAIAREAR